MRNRNEDGITTAEYCVGTAAGAGFALLLFKLLSGEYGDKLVRSLFDTALNLTGLG